MQYNSSNHLRDFMLLIWAFAILLTGFFSLMAIVLIFFAPLMALIPMWGIIVLSKRVIMPGFADLFPQANSKKYQS